MPTIFLLVVGLGITLVVFSKLKNTILVKMPFTTLKRGSQKLTAGAAAAFTNVTKPNKRKVSKWLLYGGGAIAFVLLVLYADVFYSAYIASGLSFAEDTGLGRVLSEQFGSTKAANWFIILGLVTGLALLTGFAIGWKSIVTLIKIAFFATLVYLVFNFGYNFYLEVAKGTPTYREKMSTKYQTVKKPSPPIDIWQPLNVTERTKVVVTLKECHKLVVKPGKAVDGSLERNRSTIEFWAVAPIQYRMVHVSQAMGC